MNIFDSGIPPHEAINLLMNELESTRTALDNCTDEARRNHYISAIGLQISALIRETKQLITTQRRAHPSVSAADMEHCHKLEARAVAYLNTASRIVAYAGREWPTDIRREIEAQAIDIIKSAGDMLSEVRDIVSRHIPR